MSIQPKPSEHWTDDELIALLYEVGPEDQQHFPACSICRQRLWAMQVVQRDRINDDVSPDLLAAQRRKIYARLAPLPPSFSSLQRRWASLGAATLLLAGSMFWYQEHKAAGSHSNELSDAQLAQEVSLMSQSSEAQPTAPLQALFEE